MPYRITADIDSKSKIKLFYAIYKGIKNIEKIKKIEIYKSHSGNHHLIFWTTKRYTKKKIYEIREKIGDDKRRIRIDKKRILGKNTLFDEKFKGNYRPKITQESPKINFRNTKVITRNFK